MANIPLTDFPNAPSLAPVSAPISAPAPNINFAELGGEVGALLQNEISGGALNAYGEGLNQLARGITATGTPFEKVAMVVAEGKNLADSARISTIQEDAHRAHIQEMQTSGIPVSEWVSRWEAKLPAVQQQIDALDLSPIMKERANIDFIQYSGKTTKNTQLEAFQAQIQSDKDDTLSRINRARAENRPEEAYSLIDYGAQKGLWTKGWADAQKLEWDIKAREENMTELLVSNPFVLKRDMDEAIKSGSSKEYHWMNVAQMKLWRDRAEREGRSKQIEARQDVSNAIYTGDVTEESQVRERLKGFEISEKEIKSLATLITREVQFDPEVATKLRTAVLSYDGQVDTDMAEFNRLNTDLETKLPKKEASALSSTLFQSWQATSREGKKKEAKSVLLAANERRIDTLASQGLLFDGKTGRSDPKESSKITDKGEFDRYWNQVESLKQSMRDWSEENPDATPEEFTERMNSLIGPQAAMNSVNVFNGNGGLPPAPMFSPPVAEIFDPAQESIRKGEEAMAVEKNVDSALGGKTPAAIRYNNPGAMYPGASSSKFGATGHKIIGGGHKIAVFPDAVSGAAAQFDLLGNSYTNRTLRSAIKKWSGGNNVETYLKVIEKEAGISADTMLTKDLLRDPRIAIPLVKAMARQEAGKAYPLSENDWAKAHKMAFEG